MPKQYSAFSHNKIQFGRESTAGTEIDATYIWRGAFAQIEAQQEITVVEEQLGIGVPAERTYIGQKLGRLAMPSTPATYEQLTHIMEASMKVATPTGAGPYVRAYDFGTGNTINTLKTYTLESGSVVATADNMTATYGFIEDWELTGEPNDAWMMAANWLSRFPTQKAMTALTAANLETVETILFRNTKLYLDATGGTVGTTQKTGVLMGASVRATSGWKVVPIGDGSTNFAAIKYTVPKVEISPTLELEQDTGVSLVAAERAFQWAETLRLLRLDVPGSSANLNLRIDAAVKWLEVGDYTDDDGNTTVELTGEARYSSTDALFCNVTITNNDAAL